MGHRLNRATAAGVLAVGLLGACSSEGDGAATSTVGEAPSEATRTTNPAPTGLGTTPSADQPVASTLPPPVASGEFAAYDQAVIEQGGIGEILQTALTDLDGEGEQDAVVFASRADGTGFEMWAVIATDTGPIATVSRNLGPLREWSNFSVDGRSASVDLAGSPIALTFAPAGWIAN